MDATSMPGSAADQHVRRQRRLFRVLCAHEVFVATLTPCKLSRGCRMEEQQARTASTLERRTAQWPSVPQTACLPSTLRCVQLAESPVLPRPRVASSALLALFPRGSCASSLSALLSQETTPQSWWVPALKARRVTIDDFPKRIVVPPLSNSPSPTRRQMVPCACELYHPCARDPAL